MKNSNSPILSRFFYESTNGHKCSRKYISTEKWSEGEDER